MNKNALLWNLLCDWLVSIAATILGLLFNLDDLIEEDSGHFGIVPLRNQKNNEH